MLIISALLPTIACGAPPAPPVPPDPPAPLLPASILLAPAELELFAAMPPIDDAPPQVVVVENIGGVDATVRLEVVGGTHFVIEPAELLVPAGDARPAIVRFVPAAPGGEVAWLVATADGATTPARARLRGHTAVHLDCLSGGHWSGALAEGTGTITAFGGSEQPRPFDQAPTWVLREAPPGSGAWLEPMAHDGASASARLHLGGPGIYGVQAITAAGPCREASVFVDDDGASAHQIVDVLSWTSPDDLDLHVSRGDDPCVAGVDVVTPVDVPACVDDAADCWAGRCGAAATIEPGAAPELVRLEVPRPGDTMESATFVHARAAVRPVAFRLRSFAYGLATGAREEIIFPGELLPMSVAGTTTWR